ncbi:MAG: DUF1549 and DUF1553 domain-containing protein [Verrucomicrobia bacterium]|nr:DUF1549 and DUF1553 domain-containing protein [Verrucomicrobiota bacterium]MDA1068391.1 DUF1549 and DUF1553 domain-containing protein [Verrucomicrobiota bacterium]
MPITPNILPLTILIPKAFKSHSALINAALLLVVGYGVATAEVERMKDPGDFWAFQQLSNPPVPTGNFSDWPDSTIDQFILSKLAENNLSPSQPASKAELIRRATYDLHGLPPKPEEVEEFVNNQSPQSYENLIDRLLASPRYGERWGQLWLDVIRFSESEGFEYDRELPGAWRFRDYVIRSYNEDKPFDQFIREQIAGDEFEHPSTDELIAAGFHRFGPVRRNAGNPDIALSRNEVLTERTDIIGSAFMGITMGCARCHDHKIDPISQKDYYSLQAFMAATHEYNHLLGSKEVVDAWQAETDNLKKQISEVTKKKDMAEGEEKDALNKEIVALNKELPEMLPSLLSIKNDFKERTEVRILHRGLWEFKGDLVDLRPPEILNSKNTLALSPDETQPRTKLADWLTSPENPLTARVLVNRVWQNHFSNGIVNTPNDFGYYGDRPSHPELLDYLATQLIKNGWRLKPLHRQIMLSSTYRQSSNTPPSKLIQETDPNNRLLSRFNRRRLQAEEIRDSMLAVSGRLNTEMFGESIMLPVEEEMIQLLYKPDQWQVTENLDHHNRRSVYLIAKRNLRLPFMEAFDQPTLQNSCARRESSTHAPQALELLNGDIANELAQAFALRLQSESNGLAEDQIKKAWLLVTGRPPGESELKLANSFLKTQPFSEFTLAMFNLNDFLYVR